MNQHAGWPLLICSIILAVDGRRRGCPSLCADAFPQSLDLTTHHRGDISRRTFFPSHARKLTSLPTSDTGYRAVPEESNGKDDYSPEYSSLPVCPAFKQIGKHQGPFDLGLIPIGAYDPRWIMSSMHANPMDAVNIMIDTKCQKALGMHWGTWVLTDEDVNEPPKKLREALKVKGIEEEGVFDVLDIGGSWEY